MATSATNIVQIASRRRCSWYDNSPLRRVVFKTSTIGLGCSRLYGASQRVLQSKIMILMYAMGFVCGSLFNLGVLWFADVCEAATKAKKEKEDR